MGRWCRWVQVSAVPNGKPPVARCCVSPSPPVLRYRCTSGGAQYLFPLFRPPCNTTTTAHSPPITTAPPPYPALPTQLLAPRLQPCEGLRSAFLVRGSQQQEDDGEEPGVGGGGQAWGRPPAA